jgi:hypothetical protein
MTHEELLMKLWEKRNSLCDNLDVHFALSLVVELHKPRDYKAGNWCIGCNADYEYPCPTIQAIEKELK